MKIIELFSGIGGFAKGFEDAGYTIEEHYYSEIDKHAIANYKYNYPNAKYIGSVTDIRPADFRGIDIITFGSPCQDFSLAGKRKGLEGERSSLIEYAIRLVTDVRPSVFIWENVKGAFSSNAGADFWAILQAFANIGGYRLEWQLLNTKWFLPQNRERIYLIGHLADRSEPGVFPITENDAGLNERAIETRSIRTLTAGGNSGGLHSSMTLIIEERLSSSQDGQVFNINGISQCLSAGHGNVPKIKIGAIRGRNPENPKSRESGLPTEQMLEINKEGVSNTLTSVQKDNVVIGTWRTHKDGNSPTIPARAREDGSGQPVIMVNNENDFLQIRDGRDNRSCLRSGRTPELGYKDQSIRRLTEIECERLQGFPDNWTEYGNYDGIIKKIPKTQRYKMLGNAVTVKVVETIAKRLNLD